MGEVRVALKSDIPRLKEIWAESFCDELSYIDFFYDNCFDIVKTYVYYENSYITSMAKCLDVKYSFKNSFYNGGYVYAVCTDKNFRGKGYASKIMDFIDLQSKKNNLKFLTLVPQNEFLFDMYRKMGYEDFTKLNLLYVSCTNQNVSFDIYEIEIDDYLEKRDKFLSSIDGSIDFVDILKRFSKQNFLFLNYKAYALNDGDYKTPFLCYEQGDKIYIQEVLKDVVTMEDIDKITCFFKDKNLVLQTKIIDRKLNYIDKTYSMIKFLEKFEVHDNAYMNLMFD